MDGTIMMMTIALMIMMVIKCKRESKRGERQRIEKKGSWGGRANEATNQGGKAMSDMSIIPWLVVVVFVFYLRR